MEQLFFYQINTVFNNKFEVENTFSGHVSGGGGTEVRGSNPKFYN